MTTTTKRITRAEVVRRAQSISGGIDERRWQLAELALEAKEHGPEDWAVLIANCPAVRRAPRTVRDYALVADFRRSIGGRRFDLPYSFYSRAAQRLDKLPVEVILTEMQIAAEGDTTVDMFSAILSDAAREASAPEPPSLCDWLSAEYERVTKAIELFESLEERLALERIADIIDRERASRIPA